MLCSKCTHESYCDMAQFGQQEPPITACYCFKEKQQTNADKYFRNATDEEIAELMTKTGSEFNCFPGATTADCEKAGLWWDGCKKCWLDWLKLEVDDDE